MPQDYYDLLGVAPSADEETVRAALRAELRRWHPRQNHSRLEVRQEAERHVRLLAQAQGVLTDRARRAAYDRARVQSSTPVTPPPRTQPAAGSGAAGQSATATSGGGTGNGGTTTTSQSYQYSSKARTATTSAGASPTRRRRPGMRVLLGLTVLGVAGAALLGLPRSWLSILGQFPTGGASPSPSPSSGTTRPPASVGLVDVSRVSGDARAAAVARALDDYLAGVNQRDWRRAASAWSPDVVDPADRGDVAQFARDHRSSRHSAVALRSVSTPSGSASTVRAEATFRSTQDARDGPSGQTCTDWTVHYTLSPAPGGRYQIRADDRSSRPCG